MTHKNDICWSCGAGEGLHHYETRQCPLNGREETRHDEFNNKAYPQKWEVTTFVDSGIKEFEMKAVDLHEDLVNALEQCLPFLNEKTANTWELKAILNAKRILKQLEK